MDQPNQSQPIVSDIYDNYEETQREIYFIELRKTRTKIFTIAAVIFVFDFIAIAAANLITAKTLGYVAFFPVIIALLGFLANKEPFLAMVLTIIIIAGIWIYSFVVLGTRAIYMGWFAKAILIYLMIAGVQNAKEAQRVKRELRI